MTSEVTDILQVALSEEADRKLTEIISVSKCFGAEQQDVYKFAVAVALARDLHNDQWKDKGLEGRKNKFSISGLDPDASLKHLITLLRPDASMAPYRYSQWLAIAGISFLHNELVENSRSIIDVLELDEYQVESSNQEKA